MFDQVYCLNLNRRPERWAAFRERLPADWPFAAPQRWAAVDGQTETPPTYWGRTRGAWGCFRSHIAIMRYAIEAGVRSVLILEDDAVFVDGFADKVEAFQKYLPADWDHVYLGGQHYNTHQELPRVIAPGVVRCYNVNRTHAHAMRGRYIPAVLKFIQRARFNLHIDYQFGELHMGKKYNVYAPRPWLVGQGAGVSDVGREGVKEPREEKERFWNGFKTEGEP